MINWDEFEHIHVIKKLKQILNSWWNIDVVFTDERGSLRAIDPSKSAPFVIPPSATFLEQRNVGRQPCRDRTKSARRRPHLRQSIQHPPMGNGRLRCCDRPDHD